MSLFRGFFYQNPPDHLVEISESVYAFDCCFSSDVMGEDEYKLYLAGIVAQLQDKYPDASFMVFNFREGDQRSQISDVLSQYDMTVMDNPSHYENCPLLTLEMIHHFLKSSESWLSLEGQQNVLLMHCERGGWPVLAFMLSGLLLYRKQYQGEHKTLEMVQKLAPMELLRLSFPLNPQPSQLRYLQYISRRNLGSDWPPFETPLLLDCLILRDLPHFQGRKGYTLALRVYGQEPNAGPNRSSMRLFSTPKTNKQTFLYQQEECILVKLDIQCPVQGDVVLECVHLHDDLVREEMVFRIMLHTAYVRGNILIVQRDEMDILWDAKDQFPKEFKAEVLFSGADAVVPTIATSPMSEDKNDFHIISSEEFYEVEEVFSDVIDGPDHKTDSDSFVVVDNSEATSVSPSSQAAVSPAPLPLAYYSLGHPQTSQFSSPPPSPPPIFAYVRRNVITMLPPPSLPPPPPPPPPFAYVRRNSKTMLPPPPPLKFVYASACVACVPSPPPPPLPFSSLNRKKAISAHSPSPKAPPAPSLPPRRPHFSHVRYIPLFSHRAHPLPPPSFRSGMPPPPPPRPMYGKPPPPPPPPQMRAQPPPSSPSPLPPRGGAPIPPPPPVRRGLVAPPPPPPSGGPRPLGDGPPLPPMLGARGAAVDPKGAGRKCGLLRPMYGAPPPPPPPMRGLGGAPPPPPLPPLVRRGAPPTPPVAGVREHGASPPPPPPFRCRKRA